MGSKSPSRTITDGITWPVGICVDKHDTLYVANLDQSTAGTGPGNVEEYRAGESKPYRTITDKLNRPLNVVVGKSGWLYVVNYATLHMSRLLNFHQTLRRHLLAGLRACITLRG